MKLLIAALSACLAAPLWAGGETASNPEAKVYFVNI